MTSSSPRGHFIDVRPLTTSPAFARLWVGSTLGGLGGQLTIVAVMLHMYDLTGSTFAVAMIAVAGLAPMVLAGLYGGMLADYFDRRTVALCAAVVTWLSTAVLAALAWFDAETVWSLYLLSVVNSSANSIVSATKSAITPRLIDRSLLPAAAALNGITMGIMVMAGPAAAGILVATVGYPLTYTIDVVLMLSLFLGLATLPTIKPEGATVRPGWQSMKDGLRFLRSAANIRTQFVLDIIAMTFGHPLALFPAIGAVLLGGGEVTTGLLTAAIALGAFLSSLFSGRVGASRWHGKGIARAIAWFAVATTLFGLVLAAAALGFLSPAGGAAPDRPNIALIAIAMVFLAVTGAADNISAILRSTMLQAAVPDAVRGRLQGVFIVVVAGGPRVGALYCGVFASLTALWCPPLFGGIMIVTAVALIMRATPRFARYDALDPVP